MKRPLQAAAVLTAAVLLLIYASSRITSRSRSGPEPVQAEEPGADARIEIVQDDEPSEAPRHLSVLIYYPSAEGDGLIGESHEIFMTRAPGDRAKQILADLISGPVDETALRALPPGTQLRQVYVLENGTAYIDFSSDLRQGMRGGSTEELYTVYAIVNSVVLNIPEIRRLGILIDGEPVETLNGHLDLRRPLPPDLSMIVRRQAARVVRATPGLRLAG